ncbi:MAG: filamentous hemagglutinin family protein [Gammaproteobacteria bacterium]|nr:filamentous hemagglutinin family protein [Gammaproteobacteria bacterium]
MPSGTWVSPGSGAALPPTVVNQTMNVQQITPKVTLNWDSFNIDQGHTVNFNQPSSSATALNLIHQADPVAIRGALNANGEVWLLNQNGIVFGGTAQVNVRGLIASTLKLTGDAQTKGIAPPDSQVYTAPAFASQLDAQGNPMSQPLQVEHGAQLATNGPNGRIYLFAPTVTNTGSIAAADGQVALAAGSEIYIRQPAATQGGGLIIEVGKGGVVTNGAASNADVVDPAALLGQIVSDRGTATLVGLSVNQLGRVSATSAVRANGTVRLLARNSPSQSVVKSTLTPTQGGNVLLGANSVTAANPDRADLTTAVDASSLLVGQVLVAGKNVVMDTGSRIEAHGGDVTLRANDVGDDRATITDAGKNSQSRIAMAGNSLIDASGSNATLDPSRNALSVKLQGAELKDRPAQRAGILLGKTVTVDLRVHGKLPDGRPWIGTPLADLTNSASADVKRGNLERNSVGGAVRLEAQGGVLLEAGSTIDVSGGAVTYPGGAVPTTQLIRQGKIVDISRADPSVVYEGIFGAYDVVHPKWGPTSSFTLYSGAGARNSSANGYTEGRDAGTISIVSPKLVLDGNFLGGTTPGLFQRGATGLSLTTILSRPFDQLPRRGTLTLGVADAQASPQDITPDATIESGLGGRLPLNFHLADGPLPSSANQVKVSTDWFGNGKLGFLALFSEGMVSLPGAATLDLGAGGGLQIQAGAINVAGRIRASGGNLSLIAQLTSDASAATPSSGNIVIAAGAGLDVSGLWVNDTPALNPATPTGNQPLLVDAGSISISANVPREGAGMLSIAAGSSLRTDGGAAVSRAGKLTAGKAGTISLDVKSAPFDTNGSRFQVPLVLDGAVSAFGIDAGGSLNINASSLCITATDCGASIPTRLDLTPEFFRSGGFASYSLTATGGGAVISAGTTVRPRQQNRVLAADFRTRLTNNDLREFSSIGTLDDTRRRPTDFALTVKAQAPSNQYNDAVLQSLGFLDVQTGAGVLTEPGAKVILASDTRVLLDGTISAPAGTIDVSLNSAISGAKLLEFLPSQTLWLGGNAKLLAPGSFQAIPNTRGLDLGTLLGGGAVSIVAKSGYIIAEHGSLIDVRGTLATLDITPTGTTTNTPQRQSLASGSGSITLSAAEGILFDGAVRANALSAGARAGSLTIAVDAHNRNDNLDALSRTLNLPTGPRVIQVRSGPDSSIPSGLAPDQPVPATFNGYAIFTDRQLSAAGLGDLTLHARNYLRSDIAVSPAAVQLSPNITLAPSRRLVLDAAGIDGGGSVHLNAPYVAIGNSDNNRDGSTSGGAQATGTLFTGTGSLVATADNIDFIGSVQLNGWRDASFYASGDIRLRGVQVRGLTQIALAGKGSLETSANLTFMARQVYPTTLSNYEIAVMMNPLGQITFAATAPAAPVLSVGGNLLVSAPFIMQGGNVKAPLGGLALNASDTLELLPGSVTSTSLDSATALFGRIELGQDWVYLLDGVNNVTQGRLVFTPQTNRPADRFPASHVTLRAPTIKLLANATVDQSGGGNLLAYEFQPGLNGSNDLLAANNSAGSYAILPSLKSDLAPFDPQEQQEFTLPIGESIELTAGVPGLPVGRYALLPARFALLPGAFLVTPQSGFTDLASGVSLLLPGQGTVVAGQRVFSNGVDGDSRAGGFLISNAIEVATLGQFTLASANSFAGLRDQGRPSDAGTLQIAAAQSLTLGGALRASPGTGGHAGIVEFTGNNLDVVANAANATSVPGTLLIDANGLNALGAGTVVLGGTSSGTGAAQVLSVAANRVEIKPGAHIQAPKIILAATDMVMVDGGSSVNAAGASIAASGTLTVAGDGALLQVANGGPLRFTRTGAAGAAGVLDIQPGALLSASGSTLFDASKTMVLNGALALSGALTVDAPRISLGTPAGPIDGLLLSTETLNALHVNELVLTSGQGIDLYGALNLSFKNLVIRAPGVGGYENAARTAVLNAAQITLSNPGGFPAYVAPVGATPGSGQLTLAATQITLSGNHQSKFLINGFSAAELVATARITGSGSGNFGLPGDVTLTTPSITTDSGANLALAAAGALSLRGMGFPPNGKLDSFGGTLSLTAGRIDVATQIDLPTGHLKLHATGTSAGDNVRLLDGALLDVSGRVVDFAGSPAFASGGSVQLIADHGDVLTNGNALIDAGGSSTGGAAGTLDLMASKGMATVASSNVNAMAANGYTGGSLSLDAKNLAASTDFGALLAGYSAAGFREAIKVRIRDGDLALIAGGDIVRTHALTITADGGNLAIARPVDASGPAGGSIRLAASGILSIEPGTVLDAHATASGNVGGNIELQSASATDGTVVTGGITLATGAVLNVAGDGGGGTVHLRLPRASILTVLDANPNNRVLTLNGTISGATKTILEGFRAYTDDSITVADVATTLNPRYDDAATFMVNVPALRLALGNIGAASTFHLQPGVEIRSLSHTPSSTASDLALDAIWNLSRWRFGPNQDEPGILTLRAAGNLLVNDILSDGFNGTADLARTGVNGKSMRCADPNNCNVRPLDSALPLFLNGESWSYRLVAGADLASADSLNVALMEELARNGVDVGSLTLAPGVGSLARVSPGPFQSPVLRPILNTIRTGTGAIEINAARDVTLNNRASVIYTAGRNNGAGVKLGTSGAAGRSTLQGRPYPEQGGSIWVHAGANVNGVDPTLDFTLNSDAFSRQLVTSWLLRQGDAGPTNRATGWTVAPEYFEQGIATLGGGDVTVLAGNDIYNLSVSTASIGRQVGGTTSSKSIVDVTGSGTLRVSAGHDILSGVFYVGKGQGYLAAGNSVASGRPASAISLSNDPLYTVLALGDAQITIQADNSVELADVVNPTFIPQGIFQRQIARNLGFNSYFLSYSATSSVSVLTKNGDINFLDSQTPIKAAFNDVTFSTSTDDLSLQVYPASLSATALHGAITSNAALTLYPSPKGNLTFLAGDSIQINNPLILSDIDPTALPGISTPFAFTPSSDAENALAALLITTTTPTALAAQPIHGNHAANAEVARLVAKNGDIVSKDGALLFTARPTTVIAGRDIVNFDAIVENTQSTDVSVLKAGGSVLYPSPRVASDSATLAPGSLQSSTNSVEIWGPGRLVVEAGVNADLGTAGGIISRGNTINGALTGPGAALSLFVGLGGNGLDFSPFLQRYFAQGSPYLPQLVQFMTQFDSNPSLTTDAALARFESLASERQVGVILDAFYAELRDTGRAAASSTNPNYARGYDAITTLFPGKNYAGSLNLYFSQIFTIAGGNIDLLAPGGDINVGLATPPASFGISKAPSQLGIVSESVGDVRIYLKGDLNVNESRVFAADGGSILAWSNFGNIDAGRGARSAISAPANGFQFDQNGHLTVSVPPPIQGSGIRALTTTAGRPFGNVDLVTPRGVVNASEAGIESAGNITIAAVQVLGADNIKAGGASVGVPTVSAGVSASIAGAGSSANAATKAASESAAGGGRPDNVSQPLTTASLNLISVEFIGFGG